jgi:hypothetical protein
MDSKKIRQFMQLAGQELVTMLDIKDEKTRELGAQLLLSEVLEYVIHGLGVVPEVAGVAIEHSEKLTYRAVHTPNKKELVDGLADVAYTMFWNECAFGIPLERAFEMVADNNLEKFVLLPGWMKGEGELERNDWGCNQSVVWPSEVVAVIVVKIEGNFYAVGKDKSGKVRKPSTYKSVDLSSLI